MSQVKFEENSYTCADGETVLQCLTHHGIGIPSSCQSGVCQTCLMQAVDGAPPEAAQKGLKETLRAQGYFLSCMCVPEGDMEVSLGDTAGRRVAAMIVSVKLLAKGVVLVRVMPESPVDYRAGQFVNLMREDGLARSYSIANTPSDGGMLEFHVALMPGGVMSTWIHEEAGPGDAVEVLGPQGECFYVEGKPEQPLLLVGTGTGLAPLYGIAKAALEEGHKGPIHLFHGSLLCEGLYLDQGLRDLDREVENFSYHACVLNEDCGEGVIRGAIDEAPLEKFPDLKGWRVFLCGNPDIVKLMQRKAFMAGASLSEIFADAFVPSARA